MPPFLIRDHALDHRDYVRGLTGLRGFAALWVFLYHAWVLMRDDTGKQAMKTFGYSILYLSLLFTLLLADHYLAYALGLPGAMA